MSKSDRESGLACPIALGKYQNIVMAHGGGGRLMHQLIDGLLRPELDNPWLAQNHDAAVVQISGTQMAFTTDSYVVQPLFFPGGDIGKLAVCGTLNDLAVAGAEPLFLSCALILEEGFPITDLERIVRSIAQTAEAAGVAVVTGDTKVVDKGKGDGLYVNTAGVGTVQIQPPPNPNLIQAGDWVIVNGDIGRHGIAIMAEREGLGFENTIVSDCADLSALIKKLLDVDTEIHCMRDLTRGGLAGALLEISQTSGKSIELQESIIPIAAEIVGACEILGLDPLYVANEGRMVIIAPESSGPAVLDIMKNHVLGQTAVSIGRVLPGDSKQVTLRNSFGTNRVLTQLSGEQLPRIC